MTREYVRGIIDTLSEEQFNKIVIILEQENLPQENTPIEKPKKVLTSMGSLNKYANPEMIPFERSGSKQAIRNFIEGINAVTDEPLDEEFDEVVRDRINITRELDL